MIQFDPEYIRFALIMAGSDAELEASGRGVFFPVLCLSSFIWEDGPYRHLDPLVFRTETSCGLGVRSPTSPSLFPVGLYGIINA